MNPAVTVAMWVRGKLPGREVVPYFVAQLLAGVVAAITARIFTRPGFSIAVAAVPLFPALLAEFLYTFALCYVVLNVATTDANGGNSFYGLAIGFAVTVGAFTVGKISGGVFNPAVAAGLTTIGSVSPVNSGIYYIGELAGGIVGGLVFDFLNIERKEASFVARRAP